MILRRYVVSSTGLAMAGTTLLLLLLQLIFAYIAELGNLTEHYRPLQAVGYVLWSTPEYLYGLLPITALMGSVVGLGLLAGEGALTVMRASGVSLWRIVGWTLWPASVLLVLNLLLSESIIPYTSQQAASVRDPSVSLRQGEVQGHWVRQQARLLYVQRATATGQIFGVQLLDFDPQGRLRQTLTAQTGHYQQGQVWHLQQVQVVQLATSGVATRTVHPSVDLALPLQPRWIHVATQSPELLAPSTLWRYGQYLQAQGETLPRTFRLALWQKLTAPLGLAALVILACSFIFGSLRQQTMGLRLVTALFVGLGFRYLQDFLGYVSLLFQGAIGWFILLPILLTALLGVFLLHRHR